jgi:hypothetical protein
VVRQRTAKRRLARALVAINDWCRKNRHRPVPDQQPQLSAKLIGHYAYYGITGNSEHIGRFFQQVYRSWKKWLERRTRGQPLTWAAFRALLERLPLPRPRIVHPTPSHLCRRQRSSHVKKPEAVILHVRHCGGEGGNILIYPATLPSSGIGAPDVAALNPSYGSMPVLWPIA